MANPLSVVVSSAVIPQVSSSSSQGSPHLQFSLSLDRPWDVPAPPNAEMAYIYWVLDRANPASGPTWKTLSQNPNVVPDGIQAFMDERHILVFSCLALNITSVPQGPLYEFLMKNGAGPMLTKIEALNTGFACGVSRLAFSYSLVSIPGAGVPALEDCSYWVEKSATNPASLLTNGSIAGRSDRPDQSTVYANSDRHIYAYLNNDEVRDSVTVVTSSLFVYNPAQRLLVFTLIPAADGMYMPVP
jgi:hypothetical protein